MREVASPNRSEAATLAACVATILELALDDVPQAPPGEEVTGWRIMRWLGGRGLGLVPVGDAPSFSWAGPWIGWVRTADGKRAAVGSVLPCAVDEELGVGVGHDGAFESAAGIMRWAQARLP